MKHSSLLFPLLAGSLLLTGCGYRAPLYQSYIPEVRDTTEYPGVRPAYQELAALLEKDTELEPTEGNTVTLLPDGPQTWNLLKEDLEYAEKAIYLDCFRFRTDSDGAAVESILRQKALKGTDVRLILDKGANSPENLTRLEGLQTAGAQLNTFYFPSLLLDKIFPAAGTHRNHHKMVLLDGQTGYLGSRNLQYEDFFDSKGADIRITGPAVAHLSAAYQENQDRVAPHLPPVHVSGQLEKAVSMDNLPEMKQFTDVTVQIIPESPADKKLPLRNAFEWMLYSARKYFWFYNPCTPPPASTVQALKDAAIRGVDVRWIVPAVQDKKVKKWMGESLYKELLDAGVRIYEWQGQVQHASQYMTDDYLLAVGSANMDNLSFFLNYEVEALVYDEKTTRYASYSFLSDIEQHCREITREEVARWFFFRRVRNWLTRHLGGPLG